MSRISPWPWFEDQAEEGPGEPGSAMVVSFELDGRRRVIPKRLGELATLEQAAGGAS